MGCPLDEVLDDFESAWRSCAPDQKRPDCDDWLKQLDPDKPDEAAELIYKEFALYEELGLKPSREAYLARYPQYFEELKTTFEVNAPPREIPPPLTVGNVVGPFSMQRILGEGGLAQVFLAKQTNLADRLVVLKVTERASSEPQLLARVKHPNIVDVYETASSDNQFYQILVMPFLGGETLQKICRNIKSKGRPPKSGLEFIKWCDEVAAPELPPPTNSEIDHAKGQEKLSTTATISEREVLKNLPYGKAVAWIFVKLAQALHHANRTGVAHGDVKPSNILMTAASMPMLFDFNLAVDRSRQRREELGGGTWAYMPPERLRQFCPSHSSDDQKNELPVVDIHLADIYSMGVVIAELLTGEGPTIYSDDPGVLALNRDGGVTVFKDWFNLPIPAGLRSIVSMCLAADPSDRYPNSKALATDLDCWIQDKDPVYAPLGTLIERASRYVRRNRLHLTMIGVSLLVATSVGLAFAFKHEQEAAFAATALYKSQNQGPSGRFGSRDRGDSTVPANMKEGAIVQRLDTYHVRDDPDWRARSSYRTLDARLQAELNSFVLGDLLRYCAILAEQGRPLADKKTALALLEREYARSSSQAFVNLSRKIRQELNLPSDDSKHGRPVEAWFDEYLLGVAAEPVYLTAYQHYSASIRLRKDQFWPHYGRVVAAYRLGLFSVALQDLQFCLEREPDNAYLRIAKGVTHIYMKENVEAVEELQTAVRYDPTQVIAYRNLLMTQTRDDAPSIDDDVLERLNHVLGEFGVRKESQDAALFGQFNFGGAFLLNQSEPEMADLIGVEPNRQVNSFIVKVRNVYQTGNVKKALALVQDLLIKQPENFYARHWLFFLHSRMGERRQAEKVLQEIVEDRRFIEHLSLTPTDIYLYRELILRLLERGEIKQAEEISIKALGQAARLDLALGEFNYWSGVVLAVLDKDLPAPLERTRERIEKAFSLNFSPESKSDFLINPHLARLRVAFPEIGAHLRPAAILENVQDALGDLNVPQKTNVMNKP
jgi:serine/threonine protein kinase/tetratricopeptide (TPR) repeat protein